jgi:hypothetical protein
VAVSSQGGTKDVKVVWPSRNVAFCGDELKARSCDPESKNPKAAPESVRISFGKNPIGGWIHENGQEFADRDGQSFGFTKDHTNGARFRTANGNELLDNLILFNPDKKSQWC